MYVFPGSPGCQKGAVEDLCEQELGWKYVVTGNVYKKEINKGSKIGTQIDFAIKYGKLVSDGLILHMVSREVKTLAASDSIMFDGFSGTVKQARNLDDMLSSECTVGRMVSVSLSVLCKTIHVRLHNRLLCSHVMCKHIYAIENNDTEDGTCTRCLALLECRNNDSKENIMHKCLGKYYEHEKALLNYFEGRHHEVHDACIEDNVETIFDDLTTKLRIGPYDCH